MDDIEWTIHNEGQLLDAMIGHKPVGVNKYFEMALICEKFSDKINKYVNSENIWTYLGKLYNLNELDEYESIPFPNTEKEFSLPKDEYGVLMSNKEGSQESDIHKPKHEMHRSIAKDTPIRDNKSSTKETNKDSERVRSTGRNRNSKSKTDETPKGTKRPLRRSLKIDEGSSNDNSSPIVSNSKRRRII